MFQASAPSAKRKRGEDKPGDTPVKGKKKKPSPETVMAALPLTVLGPSPTGGDDSGSDSDSDLDVEKWKRLALELSGKRGKNWERRRASEGQVKGGRETEEESRRKMSGQRGVMSQRAGEDSKAS